MECLKEVLTCLKQLQPLFDTPPNAWQCSHRLSQCLWCFFPFRKLGICGSGQRIWNSQRRTRELFQMECDLTNTSIFGNRWRSIAILMPIEVIDWDFPHPLRGESLIKDSLHTWQYLFPLSTSQLKFNLLFTTLQEQGWSSPSYRTLFLPPLLAWTLGLFTLEKYDY